MEEAGGVAHQGECRACEASMLSKHVRERKAGMWHVARGCAGVGVIPMVHAFGGEA